MQMKRWLAVSALCLALGGVVEAQTSGKAGTGKEAAAPLKQDTTPIINGMETPELIPDLVAYRMWLWSASHADNPSIRDNPSARVAIMRQMSTTDQGQLVMILASFKVQFDALVTNYNIQATAGTGDRAAFLQNMKTLVTQTNETIKTLLSPAGFAQYTAEVKASKHFIQCSVGMTI